MSQLLANLAKEEALNAIQADKLSLHNGDPGIDGSANEISGGGYARQAATFGSASGNSRALSAAVDFTGTASQAVSWIGVWKAGAPDTFRARIQITSGDLAFNASGEYRVTTATALQITDPA